MATSRRGDRDGDRKRRPTGAGFSRPTPPGGAAAGPARPLTDQATIPENPKLLARIAEKAPADVLVELLLPVLWANVVAGSPANVCVDAGHVLRNAFDQFGIRSELQLVDLVINDQERGGGMVHGTPSRPGTRRDGCSTGTACCGSRPA